MQSRHLNSKVKDDEELFNTTSKAATSKSIKHLDFRLKEHEANLIISRLPSHFLLLNLKTNDLEKKMAQLQAKSAEPDPPKNKHEAIQNKKNDKKIEAEQKKGNNFVFKKQKNPQKSTQNKLQQQQKSKSNHSLSQKALGQDNHIKDLEKAEIFNMNPFNNMSGLQSKNNMEGVDYEMEKKWNEKQKQLEYQHFGNYQTDRNGYQQKFQEGHHHFDGKIGEEVAYDYGIYEPEHHNWMSYFTFPFLPDGQPRYNPEFFQPRPEETQQKNKLLHLFGLPFAQSTTQPFQKLDQLQKRFCLNFIHRLKSHKSSQIFRVAVNPEGQGIPDYYHIVYQPMDLTTIQKKVQKDKYVHIHEFHADINKIIMNSYKYNLRETPYFITTVKFQDHYQALLKEAKENPEDFTHDPQQKIVKMKKIEDNQFYDQVQQRKKKKVEQFKTQSLYLNQNLEKGKKEKNSQKSKNMKKYDESSQMFYNSMINESNDYSLQNENYFFNSISAENPKNKKSMVQHVNMNMKKSQSIAMSGSNLRQEKSQSVKNISHEQNTNQFNKTDQGRLSHHHPSYQGKQKQSHSRESLIKPENLKRQNFEDFEHKSSQMEQKSQREMGVFIENRRNVENQQSGGEGLEKKQKQQQEYGDLQNFKFEIEDVKKVESEIKSQISHQNQTLEINRKKMNIVRDDKQQIRNKALNSEIPMKTQTLGKVKQGLDESIEFQRPNDSEEEDQIDYSEQKYEQNPRQEPKQQKVDSNGKLLQYFSIRQVEVDKSSKNIKKQDRLYSSLKLTKVQSPSFQQTSIQNPFQTNASSTPLPAMILADSSTQLYSKMARKSKKKEIDEDYKIQSEEQYVDKHVKAKRTLSKQQSSFNNEQSYSQEYSIPKNRKKISKKETVPLKESKKIQPRPRKQPSQPQNEIQARIHAEMENFYKLPPIINVLEAAPMPTLNLLPAVEEGSLNDQHSAFHPALPIPFHSSIFLDKEDNNHPEVEQGIVDIMDLIG